KAQGERTREPWGGVRNRAARRAAHDTPGTAPGLRCAPPWALLRRHLRGLMRSSVGRALQSRPVPGKIVSTRHPPAFGPRAVTPRRRLLMFRSRYCLCILCAALGLALAALYLFGATPASSAAAPKGPVSFINDVAPILKKNCFGCHGVKNPKGKLDMT